VANIDLVIDGRRKDLGGFWVSRILPFHDHRSVGPFVFLDHMGPAQFEPGFAKTVDVRPHPHIGLSTLTYLFEGEITHRDSLGFEQPILPGEVNWMTAGKGITHSERFETLRAKGGTLHGLQAWVALPDDQEDCPPAFDHYGEDVLPTYESNGLWARLVAGKAFGAEAPVAVKSPLFYIHWKLDARAQALLPAEYPERAAYIVSGTVEVEGREFDAGRMLVFAPGEPVAFEAVTPAVVVLLGGDPVGERFLDWNFVASSTAKLEKAKDDWRAGRFRLPPTDNQEFIPLPETPSPAPVPPTQPSDGATS
jgi:redox-sensitive bicupin YhaK (pirin superfamily)